jgi:hypothetical protein
MTALRSPVSSHPKTFPSAALIFSGRRICTVLSFLHDRSRYTPSIPVVSTWSESRSISSTQSSDVASYYGACRFYNCNRGFHTYVISVSCSLGRIEFHLLSQLPSSPFSDTKGRWLHVFSILLRHTGVTIRSCTTYMRDHICIPHSGVVQKLSDVILHTRCSVLFKVYLCSISSLP